MTDTRSLLTAALSDRYRIERELGQGGMATVYLAEDLKHRRKVALKVLRPELAATLGPERFFREIEVAAQLQHPNILPLHDSGEADGFLYYVMPFVQGESLRERLAKQGELPIHEAVKILCEVVDALAAAHALGVVHRDIKPDNVMLSGRHALVTDFGVAKAVSEATGRSQLTTAGVALGTPAYMAPEQAAADPHLDHRVDIYAVGCMGYELLTGRPPFTRSTPQEVLAAHVTQAPEPVERYRDAVPPTLSAVVMKCLAKRPADRWQTAEALLAQLEPLATPSGGMTPTQTRPIEAAPIERKSRTVWSVVIITALVLSAVAAVVLTRPASHVPATLRDRTQITTSGDVRYPAISPDGKQLAYAVTDCGTGGCRYGIELTDLGGGASRRLVQGATAIYFIQWSPDRRNLLFNGSFGGHYGNYLVSVVGGAPRLIAAGGTVFWAGGDSLLTAPVPRADSVFWIGVAGMDGVSRDSVRVAGPADGIFLVGAVPGSPWFVVGLNRQPEIEWRAIDRRGREGSRITWTATGGPVAVSADAVWAQSFHPGANPRPPIIRVPFDARTGRFSAWRDTVYTGQVTQFSVTADGGTLVLDEGSSEYTTWNLDTRDALRGAFAEDHRLLRSTTPVLMDITRDGSRVLIRRTGGVSGGGDQLTVAPFGGGNEIPIPLSGSLFGWAMDPAVDSQAVALGEKAAAGVRLTTIDLRTGARRGQFAIADSAVVDFAVLPDGGWVWIPADGRSIRVQRRGDAAPKSFPVPGWYINARGVTAAPDGKAVAIIGYDAATYDSLGLSVMSLADGKVTRWAAIFGESSYLRWLPDGSILFTVWETQETATPYRLRGPRLSERLGTVPRPVTSFGASSDLRRAVVVTREYHGDAWMSRVVRP